MPAGKLFVRISWVSSSGRPRRSAHRRVLVAPVEVAEEVAAVLAVEREQRRRLGQRAQHVAHPLGDVQPAGGEPRVALDDVAGDQRVLEVERGHVAGRVEAPARRSRPLRSLRFLPGVRLRPARAGRSTAGGSSLMYVGQSTARGSKLNAAWSAASSVVPHRQQVVDLVDRLALGVEAVQLDVLAARGRRRALALLELRRPRRLLAAQRQRLQQPARRG